MTYDQFSQLVMTLYRGCREQPVAEFQDWALEQVKAVLPFDSAVWLTGVLFADGNARVHTLRFHKQPPQLMADWEACADKSSFTQKVFSSPGTTFNCVTSRDLGPALARHARSYGIEHILATTRIDTTALLNELISLYRADAARPFTEEERAFQQALVPHLSETWRCCRMLALTHASQPACTALSRSAAADGNAVLHLIEPGFTRLLQAEWPDWRGPQLPAQLQEQIAHKRLRFTGNDIVVALSELDELFLLRGRCKSRLDELTQREREVAHHFSAGRNHKEIAKSCAIAPATVRNYLSNIYRKLEINNKAALTNMLRDHD